MSMRATGRLRRVSPYVSVMRDGFFKPCPRVAAFHVTRVILLLTRTGPLLRLAAQAETPGRAARRGRPSGLTATGVTGGLTLELLPFAGEDG
jgi:hypothetical protein